MPDKDNEKKLQEFVEKEEGTKTPKTKSVGPKITEVAATPLPWQRSDEQISMGNEIGWQKIPIGDLPTRGLFYPEGAEVAIRSATAEEIRHWSTLQETNLSELDDMLNYVLERCISFKLPEGASSSWKDIKEVDRFYILLAVREYTFVKGDNNLQVKTSEAKTINVTKEMIDYVNFTDKLMEYYDNEKRCFSLRFKTGEVVDVTIPSVGVTQFLKKYIYRKQQQQQLFDTDFITFAPFVIKDWKGLNDNTYEQIVIDSNGWSIDQISVLTHLKDLFLETINPVIKYTDDGGAEQTAPLNFLGGIKSVFLISDPFAKLV